MFLAQVLSADGSCQQALDDYLVKRVMAGLEPGSTETGAFCKARARLPLSLVSSLARETGYRTAGVFLDNMRLVQRRDQAADKKTA